MLGPPTKAHLSITQINSIRLHFYWSYKINHMIETFKNYFEKRILEIEL